MKKEYYMGQQVLHLTVLFGKPYFWMKDGDGVVYLTKAREQKGASVGSDGTATMFTEGWVPDFS